MTRYCYYIPLYKIICRCKTILRTNELPVPPPKDTTVVSFKLILAVIFSISNLLERHKAFCN